MRIVNLKEKIGLYLGKPRDVSLKHRSAILLLSVLTLFVDPRLVVTFEKASAGGLGISFDPTQSVNIGIILFALLIYRLVAFWVSLTVENGTDVDRVAEYVQDQLDPAWKENANQTNSIEQVKKNETNEIVRKVGKWAALWNFMLPNVLALVALIVFAGKYFTNSA